MTDLSPEELRSLLPESKGWIEPVAASIATVWSRELGQPVTVTPIAAPSSPGAWDQPAAAARFAVADCPDPLQLELDTALTSALLDARAGASRPSAARVAELTEIEQVLLRSLLVSLPSALTEAWSHRLTVNSLTDVSSTSSQDVEPPPPAATYRVGVLGVNGQLTLRMSDQLRAQAEPPAPPAAPEQLTAVLAEFELPTDDLNDLQVGDIITTDQSSDAPLTIHHADQTHPATPGRLGDQKAVQRK